MGILYFCHLLIFFRTVDESLEVIRVMLCISFWSEQYSAMFLLKLLRFFVINFISKSKAWKGTGSLPFLGLFPGVLSGHAFVQLFQHLMYFGQKGDTKL